MKLRQGVRPVTELERKRRLVRALLGNIGRGYAQSLGVNVTNNPTSIFQLLCLSILASGQRDQQRAAAIVRSLREHGMDSAARLARARPDNLATAIRSAGRGGAPDQLAATLADLAQAVMRRHGGDLRRLRTDAKRDPIRERELLKKLPGVDDRAVDLFFREIQALWGEVAPFADRRALTAARRLGLGRSSEDLASIYSRDGSERLAWLVGALAAVDQDNRYREFEAMARG